MDLRTAISVFQELESDNLYSEDELPASKKGEDAWNPPQFNVRLDARTDSADHRTFRVFVTAGPGDAEEDDWRFVLDLAQRYELRVDVENNGIELR